MHSPPCFSTLIPVATLVALGGCDTGHLPNPVLLPVHAVTNGIQNANYTARRKRVATYVKANHGAIIAELRGRGGPHATQAADLARVPPSKRPAMYKTLSQDIRLYETEPEPLIVAFMVHGT
ncbi:MAG: hypothetical protein CSA70_10610 [Rhodobacterales bacterium]|nr:MAG: hypothetical protein CSA70_10610 [Rhodobacterales bacterium]